MSLQNGEKKVTSVRIGDDRKKAVRRLGYDSFNEAVREGLELLISSQSSHPLLDAKRAELASLESERNRKQREIDAIEGAIDETQAEVNRLEDLQPSRDDEIANLERRWQLSQREPDDPVLEAKARNVNLHPVELLEKAQELGIKSNGS